MLDFYQAFKKYTKFHNFQMNYTNLGKVEAPNNIPSTSPKRQYQLVLNKIINRKSSDTYRKRPKAG